MVAVFEDGSRSLKDGFFSVSRWDRHRRLGIDGRSTPHNDRPRLHQYSSLLLAISYQVFFMISCQISKKGSWKRSDMPPKIAQSLPHSLLPFLHSQSQSALTRLYSRPSACLAIFRYDEFSLKCHFGEFTTNFWRLLGPIERQIIMNLLWLDSSLPAATFDAWITKDGREYAFLYRV